MWGAVVHTMPIHTHSCDIMVNILALDTATDACSVALRVGGKLSHRMELIPRQHYRRLFSMLREVTASGALRELGVELLAYNHGPGSFTGLRIAASAVQGLAYSSDLPVAGISTLACLAQGAWRQGVVAQDACVLAMLDARINELYWGLYEFEKGCARALRADCVCGPAELPEDILHPDRPLVALGSGLAYLPDLPQSLQSGLTAVVEDRWPDSQDLLALAERAQQRGELVPASEVHPVYLRNEIHWKKLSEQG